MIDREPVHMRMRSRWLAALGMVLFGLIALAEATTGSAVVRAGWGVASICFMVAAIRYARLDLVAAGKQVVIRNPTRTYKVPLAEVAELQVGDRGNMSGAVQCVIVVTRRGQRIRAVSTASYTKSAVEGMRDRLEERLQPINERTHE